MLVSAQLKNLSGCIEWKSSDEGSNLKQGLLSIECSNRMFQVQGSTLDVPSRMLLGECPESNDTVVFYARRASARISCFQLQSCYQFSVRQFNQSSNSLCNLTTLPKPLYRIACDSLKFQLKSSCHFRLISHFLFNQNLIRHFLFNQNLGSS